VREKRERAGERVVRVSPRLSGEGLGERVVRISLCLLRERAAKAPLSLRERGRG
jgi:hypothetical protein